MPTIPLHPPPTTAPAATPTDNPPLLLPLQNNALALLELQATLHLPPCTSSTSPPIPIGHLCPATGTAAAAGVPAVDGARVDLCTATQRMTGVVRALRRPVAVVQARGGGDGDTDGDGGDADELALQVVRVVRFKVVFAGRPEPVGAVGGAG